MKKMIRTALSVAMVTALAACGGGGGGTSTGGVSFTHAELAQEFVRRVNVDVSGYDLSLVKTNTLQYDYIVVYDHDYGTYDAYYIGSYNPGENLASYLEYNENKFYYDLIPEGGNEYRDYVTGTLFEVDSATSMDLDQVAQIKQMVGINKAAQNLRETYGMSQEAALDTARFAAHIQTAPAGSVDKASYDLFAKGLTGSSITEFQNDIKAGNTASLTSRLNQAQERTGMSADGMAKLFGK